LLVLLDWPLSFPPAVASHLSLLRARALIWMLTRSGCAVLCCDWSSAGHCPCRSSGCGFADCRRGMASSTWRAGVMRRCSLAWQPAASSVRKPLAGFSQRQFRTENRASANAKTGSRQGSVKLCVSVCLSVSQSRITTTWGVCLLQAAQY